MKSILYFGLGYVIGGLCVGYSISYYLKRSGLIYDRDLWNYVSSISQMYSCYFWNIPYFWFFGFNFVWKGEVIWNFLNKKKLKIYRIN